MSTLSGWLGYFLQSQIDMTSERLSSILIRESSHLGIFCRRDHDLFDYAEDMEAFTHLTDNVLDLIMLVSH